jgi:DNA-binding CsgD family transcriptional regulator
MSEAILAVFGAPTVVLVHGACLDGSRWTGVIAPVDASGTPVAAPANPLHGISGTLDDLGRVLGAIAAGLHAPAPPAELTAPQEVAALPSPTDGGPPPGPSLPPVRLSGREVDVLRLVADGLTNAQIAERLFLSPKTVSSHLVTIFGKLGVTCRAGATRFAIEHGLV